VGWIDGGVDRRWDREIVGGGKSRVLVRIVYGYLMFEYLQLTTKEWQERTGGDEKD
jgi:hypothetical protein